VPSQAKRGTAHWQHQLVHPIRDRRGKTLNTLHDARAYVLKLGDGVGARQHSRRAIELMLVAAGDGDASRIIFRGGPSSAALLRSHPSLSLIRERQISVSEL
jgi:hypothetical protein